MEIALKKVAFGKDDFFPIEWEKKYIEELCRSFTKQTGFDYSTHIKPKLVEKIKDGVIPFIQNKDFDVFNVNFDTNYFIPEEVAIKFPRILLDERCLLISISGSIGKVGVFNNQKKAFIGGAIAVGKFKNLKYLDWVMYFLLSDFGQRRMLKDVKAGSHQNLILDDIRKIEIPFPPLKEQIAITKALSDTDTWINSLEKLLTKKRQIKQGAMQELLKAKDGWEVKKLGEIVDFKNGAAHENSVDKNGKYNIVNSKFISQDGNVVKHSNLNLCPLYKGEITMVMSDIPNGKALAKCYIIEKDNLYTLNQRICAFKAKEGFDEKFIYYKINRNDYYLAFDSGSGQTNLRKDEVLNCPIVLPKTKEEQTHIATILSDMDDEIEQLETKLAKAKQIKQGMMQELLTGRIRLV